MATKRETQRWEQAVTTAAAVRGVGVMGVAGCGKSTLARALADRLAWPFLEGDDFHDAEARRRMAAGVALTDAERGPWLDRIAAALTAERSVLACSALKAAYRARLPGLAWIWLDAPPALIAERLAARSGHFFPAALAESQFAILEPPADGLALSAALPMAAQIEAAEAWVRARL